MRKIICLMAVCLLLSVMTPIVSAKADVRSMLDELPTVEEFQAMDSDARQEAYNRTQAAYDAYMALGEAERKEIAGGEETFAELFGYFNSQVMPIEAEAVQNTSAPGKDRTETLLSGVLVLAVVVLVLRILNRKRT